VHGLLRNAQPDRLAQGDHATLVLQEAVQGHALMDRRATSARGAVSRNRCL
jgi:hypothetical protein